MILRNQLVQGLYPFCFLSLIQEQQASTHCMPQHKFSSSESNITLGVESLLKLILRVVVKMLITENNLEKCVKYWEKFRTRRLMYLIVSS